MSRLKKISEAPGTPPPSGPYSHAVAAEGRFLFVSGQGPYDPAQKKFVRGTIAEQTLLTLNCLDRIIQEAGGKRENIVSCRVYLQPLDSQTFAAMNGIYEKYFGSHRPARATVGTQLLQIDVEIECVVLLE